MTPEEASRGLRLWWLVYREINYEYLHSNQHLQAQADDACHTNHACDDGIGDSSASRNSRTMRVTLCQAERQNLLFSS